MNPFPCDDERRPDSGPDDVRIEFLLMATREPGPSADLRERVLASMVVAAVERRSILAAHPPRRSEGSSRVFPEAIAGAAAALCVLVMAWHDGRRAPAPAAPAVVDQRRETAADEPPDVHRALELLDARRNLFASVHAREEGMRAGAASFARLAPGAL